MSEAMQAPIDEVYDAAVACQSWHSRWHETVDSATRLACRKKYEESAVQLYEVLRPYLERLAHRWYRSSIASDTQSLALNMFAAIIVALPRLELDPSRNVRALLLKIAHRGACDLYREDRHAGRRRAPAAPYSDGEGTSRESQALITVEHMTDVLPDPASLDAEDAWVRRIDSRAELASVLAFWRETLSPIDWQIVQLRLQEASFKEIALELPGEWEEAAVRQRYHRIIQRTRAHFKQTGEQN